MRVFAPERISQEASFLTKLLGLALAPVVCICKYTNTVYYTYMNVGILSRHSLTLYGNTKTAEQQTVIQQYGDWYTGLLHSVQLIIFIPHVFSAPQRVTPPEFREDVLYS